MLIDCATDGFSADPGVLASARSGTAENVITALTARPGGLTDDTTVLLAR